MDPDAEQLDAEARAAAAAAAQAEVARAAAAAERVFAGTPRSVVLVRYFLPSLKSEDHGVGRARPSSKRP